MTKVKFGNIVRDVKINIDRNNNPYEHYIAGDHMDSEDLTIHRFGYFATDDVGPAFTRLFKPGQILYGSRRTYLKKIAVADFEGICANTTFVLESKDESVFETRLLPFLCYLIALQSGLFHIQKDQPIRMSCFQTLLHTNSTFLLSQNKRFLLINCGQPIV